jgi:uncharacterized membrane protein
MDLPLHPKLVHLPIALAILMPLLSSGLLLAIWREWFPRRIWALVAAGQLLLVVSGILALRSGENDEDRVERLVPKAALEHHEETAETFVWASGALLLLSVLPLVLRNRKAVLLGAAATCAGSVAVLGLGYEVGQVGGEIVYRHVAGAQFGAAVPAAAGPARTTKHGDDDDR